MKRHIRASGLTALTLSALTTMNCTTEKVDAAYIGPSQIEIQDGKMTPEVLLSLAFPIRNSRLTAKPSSTASATPPSRRIAAAAICLLSMPTERHQDS